MIEPLAKKKQKFSTEKLQILSVAQKELLLNDLASRLVGPYSVMAVILVIFGIIIKFSPLPNQISIEDDTRDTLKEFIKQIPKAIRIPHLLLGVIALFLYVGVEVMAGDSLTQFGKSLKLVHASILTSYTMAFMVLGYMMGIILIPKVLKQSTALVISAVLGIGFAICSIISSSTDYSFFSNVLGWLNNIEYINIPLVPNSVFFVTLLGFANALMWPAIWPLALHHNGKYTKIASALLIMGIAGGALIPPTYAKLGQNIGFQNALWIMVPCYLYIFYYAIAGHKIRQWSR